MRIYNRKRKEWVEFKTFLKEWKQGIERITPLQQTTIIQFGYIITAIGIIWGIIFSLRLGYKWMAVILFGGMIVLAVQYLGNWQKKQVLKRMEEQFNNADFEVKEIKEETNNGITVLVR